ncbi:hypothetical protein LTR04_000989, partial [Oleoguttula sp. CCFEE 6159]
MQCYTELTPPTAITRAVTLPFLGPKAHNLVVAKTSLLQVFDLRTIISDVDSAPVERRRRLSQPDTTDQHFLGGDLHRTEQTSKLVLVGEYALSGTITSLARIKVLNTKAGGETLLLSFKDAKLSLVEWDPERHNLSTISIHYYEGEDLQGAPWAPDLGDCHNYLTADPSSRCAALKFGARHLAILPFRQIGDDLVEAGYNSDLDTPPAQKPADLSDTNGVADNTQTPYTSSFVLPLTALDPSLTHPVHLAFLYEYREPTFGIISSAKASGSSLFEERRDILTYNVFTLDLEQRASTTLLSVSGLPYDLFQVVPLPLPVGGALLIGGNEFVHVDQAGKTNAVGVNEFARQCSTFSMADQSDLALRLEGCTVEQLGLDTGDMLVILSTGELAMLSFRLDGRSVSGLSLQRVADDRGGLAIKAGASCTASLGRSKIFVGSEAGDSVILGWTRKTAQLTRKRSHAQMLDVDSDISLDEDDLEDLDDDLYGGSDLGAKQDNVSSPTTGSAPSNYTFRVHDTLTNLAPIRDICLSKPAESVRREDRIKVDRITAPLELVAITGQGRAGGLAVLNRDIHPLVLRQTEFSRTKAIWTVNAKKPAPKGLAKPEEGTVDTEAEMSPDADYDQFMIVSRSDLGSDDLSEESKVYSITFSGFEEKKGTEFELDGATIDVGTLAGGTRIVQVREGALHVYDSELGLAQIMPMEDEITDAELKVVSASFADPYLLILRDDASAQVLEADSNGDIDELERGDALLATKWLSGCVYKSPSVGGKALVFLLSAEGGLHIFELPNLSKPVCTFPSLSFLPPFLSADYAPRRSADRETLTEIVVADLGDKTSKSPYLIVRTATDDLILYQPYSYFPDGSSLTGHAFASPSILRFLKISHPHIAKYSEDSAAQTQRPSPLRALSNVGGYSTVFMAGASPSFVLKEASSAPKVLNLRGKVVRGLTGFHTASCEYGFAYVSADDTLRECQLPSNTRYGDSGWATRTIPLGQDVNALCYHPPKGVYVVGTSERLDFTLPADDFHDWWKNEDILLRPQIDQGMLQLFDPPTGTVVNTYPLDPTEVVVSMRTLDLEVSEKTHARKQLVAVGTALIRGEDLPTKGAIYVFNVIDVVPEPGKPETGKKLKLVAKEEVKGAVTAVSGIGTQGLLIIAQGQKLMVRGLKEDGSLLPVAFLDVQCTVSALKELDRTGLWLAGDMWKGIWFGGYSHALPQEDEPYKLTMLGKGRARMEVVAAEFLPWGDQLYIIVADAHGDLHVLQFDPEHPKSLSGQRLLHKTAFHTGHAITSLTLLPSTLPAAAPTAEPTNPAPVPSSTPPDLPGLPQPSNTVLHHVLLTTATGSLALITPLPEPAYRRLTALSTHLANYLDHPAGLNPRAYRAVERHGSVGAGEGFAGGGGSGGGGMGGRSVVDGNLVRRIWELGMGRREEVLGRAGGV